MESMKNFTDATVAVDEVGFDVDNRTVQIETKVFQDVVPVVFGILLVAGLAANFLVVYVTVVTNRTAKHPIHSIFVLNLAISDVIFLVLSGPYWIVILTVSQWRFGSFLCFFLPFVTTTTVFSAIYTICALGWIRFMALTMPFRFRRSCMAKRKSGYIIIFTIWICGCLLSMPYLFNYGLKQRGSEEVYVCEWTGSPQGERSHAIVKLIAYFLIPLVLVIFFYSVVMREVLCYMMHRNSMMGQERSTEKKECVKSTVVVLFLMTAFLICWLPHLLHTMFWLTGYHSGPEYWKSSLTLTLVGKAMSYAHAIVNPIIYTFASPVFRNSLRSSLRKKVRKCSSAARLCTKRLPNPIPQGNNRNAGVNAPLQVTFNAKAGPPSPTANIYEQATTPNSELQHMLATESHATEITHFASPDLSPAKRRAQDATPINQSPEDTNV